MKRWLLLPTVVICMLILSVFAYPATRWRLSVIAMKAGGDLEAVGWTQLLHMMRPDSGISLGSLAESGNPFIAIRNPLGSNDDRKRGKELFDYRCSQCHGDAAGGGEAPALVDREFIHGGSDWALFLTI